MKVDKLKTIYDIVANMTGVDMTVKTRKEELVKARYIFFALSRQYTHASLKEIAGFAGGYNHTMVIHAGRWIQKNRKLYKWFNESFMQIEDNVIKEFGVPSKPNTDLNKGYLKRKARKLNIEIKKEPKPVIVKKRVLKDEPLIHIPEKEYVPIERPKGDYTNPTSYLEYYEKLYI